MTRRIVQIIGTLDRDAAGTQLLSVTEGLARDEFDIHVCSLAGGPLAAEFQRRRIPLTILGNSWRLDASVCLRLRRQLAQLAPDVVHTWGPTASRVGRWAASAARAPTIVATPRDSGSSSSWGAAMVDRWLARRTHVTIVDSPRMMHRGPARWAGEVRVIPPGMPSGEPGNRSRQDLLADLRLPQAARLIGAAGRLNWPAEIKDLIWAADLLKVIRDDVHLLLIGDGPQRKNFERYRRLCHIDDKVHFLGIRDDLAQLVPHFDLLWSAGRNENLSMVMLQAMASGLPVVASDTPSHRELVTPGETGYLVPLGDRAGFARRANAILDDSGLARRLSAGARRRIAADFTVESMVQNHAAVYRGDREPQPMMGHQVKAVGHQA